MTLPPTSPHAIVWCGDTPVLQSPGDRRERGKRKPRLGGPCRPVSSKDSIKASHKTRNRPEECLDSTMAGRPRALFVTKRHSTSHIDIFLPPISETGFAYSKSNTWSPAYINETKTPASFFL